MIVRFSMLAFPLDPVYPIPIPDPYAREEEADPVQLAVIFPSMIVRFSIVAFPE
jgi:hypothetical protein